MIRTKFQLKNVAKESRITVSSNNSTILMLSSAKSLIGYESFDNRFCLSIMIQSVSIYFLRLPKSLLY